MKESFTALVSYSTV